jgi:ABC-type hemin transport system ATPase subunit
MSDAKISAMLRVISINMPTSSRKLSHGAENLSHIRLSCKSVYSVLVISQDLALSVIVYEALRIRLEF